MIPYHMSYFDRFFSCILLLCTIFCCIGGVSAATIAGMMEIPEYASAGEAIAIVDYISNHGSTPYGPFVLSYHISTVPSLTAAAIYVGEYRVPQLAPRSEQRAPIALMIPPNIPEGEYYIIRSENGVSYGSSSSTVFIAGGVIQAAPVKQNDPSSSIVINEPVPPFPAPVGVSFPPLQAPIEVFIEEGFVVTDAIHNGDAETAKLIDVTYSLLRDPNTLRGKQVGSWKVLNLKSGETRHNEKMVSGSGLSPGYYYLMREAKMVGSTGVTLLEPKMISLDPILARYNPLGAYPDLTQIKTEFPSRPTPGSTVDITDVIANVGNTCASDVTVAYYASPYPVFDPAGALLLGHSTIGMICPGDQISIVTSVTVPQITSGAYYLYSVIDPCTFIVDSCSYIYPELRKDNNINGGTIKAGGHCFTGRCVFS